MIYAGMSEPEFSDEEIRTLIDYARRKFAAERWPMSPGVAAGARHHGKARSETGASAVAGAGKAHRAELADGEEAAAVEQRYRL